VRSLHIQTKHVTRDSLCSFLRRSPQASAPLSACAAFWRSLTVAALYGFDRLRVFFLLFFLAFDRRFRGNDLPWA